MWISKAHYLTLNGLIDSSQARNTEMLRRDGERVQLQAENARLRSDLDWFKHRLNQVERERGQLIQAAIGVKIAVPEFVPTYEAPDKALMEMPDFATVGNDAADQDDSPASDAVDYSNMPKRGR